MTLAFFDFGFSEMLLVGVVALLVFGGNLPEVMRNLGRSYAKLRATLREFTEPMRDEIRRATRIPPPAEGTISVDGKGAGDAVPVYPPYDVETDSDTGEGAEEGDPADSEPAIEAPDVTPMPPPRDDALDEPPPV